MYMQYISTRGQAVSVTPAQAIVQGLASDGGLYVPKRFEPVSVQDIIDLDYTSRAVFILQKLLHGFSKEELTDCVKGAYGKNKFDAPSPAPVVKLKNGVFMLELWHGPTCAFKDMALQMLPGLLTHALDKTDAAHDALILVATSGDTGKAALEGFKNVPRTRILVFYPEDGVSAIQKWQMNTTEGDNVCVSGIVGNFDDAQTGVKRLFGDFEMAQKLKQKGLAFSSANSINWGRLAPQIVYYFSAYCDLVNGGEIRQGDQINFVVPTGNFENILDGYYAKKMGLPVKKFICASNQNKILTDFINTGVYDRNRDFYTTLSPSMDILISSNLERLLYNLHEDAGAVKEWMEQLKMSGRYEVGETVKQKISNLFYGAFCGDQETCDAIRNTFEQENYLCDTHTAVAKHCFEAYQKQTGDNTPAVIVSTASPYKFGGAVLGALGGDTDGDDFALIERLQEKTGVEMPAPIAGLRQLKSRFNRVCDTNHMANIVLDFIKG